VRNSGYVIIGGTSRGVCELGVGREDVVVGGVDLTEDLESRS
jgi:hypothetical protein